jgi:ribonuclease G
MSKELIVSTARHETRVAILEDDQLVEVFHEREKEYSLAGSIQKGRVTRVLPGMQSAFVDIGLERDAFLYVSDFFEDNEEYDAVVSTVEEKVLKMEKGAGGGQERAPERERTSPVRVVEADAGESARPAVVSPVLVSPAATPEAEVRRDDPRRDEPRRDDQRRDGRPDRQGGRRGRRRRGGRGGSSLPDSKFYSPRTSEAPPEAETASEAARVAAEPSFRETFRETARRPVEGDDDFMVLPGESLAKYAVADLRDEEEALEPEPEPLEALAETAAEAAEVETEPEIEPALPAEHPLAGFGAVSSWASAPQVEEIAAAPVVFEEAPVVIEEAPVVIEEDSPEVLPPAEELEVEAQASAETSEQASAEASEEETEEVEEFADSIQEVQIASGEEEGPEPARIPTSLTAALREQGHRYPHRVSRRMRRKMRGGQPGEERGPQGREQQGRDQQENAPQESAETSAEAGSVEVVRTAEVREERRPDLRQERGGRDRSRSERPDRERPDRERPDRERPVLPSISDLLKEGQEIIVQIAKEPLGQKGARITSHIALPGRFVVYMPTVDHAGVSRKIPSEEERQRLKRIVQTHRQAISGGFICRTAAEGKSEEELKSDMHFLYNLWLDMRAKAEKRPAPVLLHHDLDLVQRILRDQLTTSFKTIWVDNEELYESVLRFAERFQPGLVGRIKLYTRANPIFDEFGITAELEKALRPKVWLKSGGHIVINQTEALVAIDINTGKYVGKSNRLEDTIVKVNTDAIKEIVRQIRLRDLGGIIVVDFIDMDERKNRQKVMQVLEEAMRSDRAPYKILQFNDFGLVAITRKRVKQSLERTLCAPCPYCEGAGYVKSVQTVVGEILQEAQRMQKALAAENTNIVLRVNPEVAKVLKSNQNQFLQEIEEIVGKSVLVKSDPLLHQTKFDLA